MRSLTAARRRMEITIEELADVSGISERRIRAIEADRLDPTFTEMHMLALALTMPLWTVFKWEIGREKEFMDCEECKD